jgi:flagellar hook assembly protein FlgD
VDSAAPVTAILSPAANAFIGNSVTVIITAEDPQPGTGIGELTVWAEGGAPVLAQPTANANEFTATLDVSGITQGSVSLNAQASDIVHNQSGIAQISVFKDTVGPEITIISPTQGTILGLSAMNAEFTIVDQALDSTSINCSLHQFVAEISGFGAPLENVVHAPVHLQGNTWSCTLDLFLIDASRVHRLVVSAADTAGNISEAHTPIIVDAVNPVFVNPTVQPQVISPINNSSKGIQDSAIVTVFVQEVNLTQWNLSVLNDNGQEVKQFNGSSPDVHITWYGNDQNDAMLSNGLYSFVFAAFDAAGNHAQLVMTPTVMIDNESPQMSLSLDDSYKPQNTLHLINVTATDNDVIALVEFWDEFSAPKTINPAADGSFQYEWPSTALAPGSYTLYARATDRAGNNSTASVIIEIKKSIAPEVSIIDPMNNSVLSGRSVPVTVTFSSDKGKVSSVSLIMDGTEIGILSPAPNQSQVAFSVDTTTYIDGNHTFTAKAVRGNPNNGDIAVSAPVSIVVHNGSPRIVFIEPVAFSPVPEGPVQIIAAISSPEEIFINADDISFAIEHMRKGVIQSSFEPAFQFANGILTSTISVDEGEYRIILTATDEAGNSSSKIQWFFAGLTISPDIEFFNPSNTESITLRYFVPEESRISIQAYKVEDDSLFSTIVNDQIQASGWQEAQWHGIGDDGAVAPDGGYYFRGNALSLSSGTSFQYSLPYTFPDNGEIVSNNSTAIQHNVEQKDFITWRVAQKALVSIFDNTCGAGSRIFHLSGEHTTEVDVRSCYGSLFETTPQVDYSLSVNNVPWNTVRAYGNTPVVESVSVYPHRLNPDISEISELRFTLKQDAFVSVSVVQNGVEVFAVLMDRVWVAADGTETVLTLNGWNDRGEALSDGPHEIRILTEDPSGNAAIYKAVLWVRRDPVIMIADNVITGKALFGEEVSILINGEIIESDLRTESGIYHKEIAHEPGTYLLRVETRDPERPATVYSTETQMRLYDWRNVDFNDVMAIYPEDGESLSFSFTLPEPAIISILMTPDSGGERKNILLFNKRNFDAGTHTITWDGRDGDGRILEQGYRIQVIDNSTMSSSIVKYLRVFVSMYHFVNNPKLQNINGEWFMQFDSGAMAIGEIQWGPSATYDQSSQENMFYRKHKLPLGQLESGTYHFRISTIALFGIRGRAEGSFSIPDGSVNLTFHTVNGPLSSVSRNQSAAVSSLPLLDENAETGSEDNDESPVYMAANTEWQEYGGELGIQSQSHSEQQIAQDTTAVTSGVQTRFLAAANVTNPFGTSQQAANCSRSASKITRKGCYTKIHTFVKGLNHWGDGFWTYGNANFGFGINGSTYLHPQLTYSYFDWQVDPMCGCGLPLCMYTYRNSGADRFMSENHGGPCNWLFKHWGYIDSGVILVDDGINTQGRPYFDIDTVEGKPNTYTPGNHDPHDGVTIDDIRNDEYCALPDNYSARTKAIIHVNQWDFQHDRCSGSEMSNSRIKGAHYFKNFFSRVHAPAEACWQQPLEVEIDVKSVWGLGGYSVIMSGAANAPVSVSDIRKFTIPSLGLSSYYITLWDKAGNEHRHRMETSAVAPRIGKDLYGSNESNPIVARPKGTRVMLYAFAHGYADGMIRCPSQVYLTDPALGSITLQEVTRTLSSGVEECRYEVMYKPGIQPATGEICVKEPNLECETCREIRVECAANYEWDASKNKCVRK